MKKRLATIAAAVALGCSLSSSAAALTINDPGVLGIIKDAVPFGDADVQAYMNAFLSLAAGSPPTLIGTETYTRNGVANPGSNSVVSLISGSCMSTPGCFKDGTGNMNVPAGYEYLIAKYDGPNGGAVVFYLGGKAFTLPATSFDIWTNKKGQGYGLSGWLEFNTYQNVTTTSVPDGGSTVAMLGSVLLALGFLGLKFTKIEA